MVTWEAIRRHFKHERRRRGLTQKQIAFQGQVDQGAISKIEADPAYMPTVMTLMRAIEGLGYVKISQFFAEIELTHPEASDTTHALSAAGHAQDRPVPTASAEAPDRFHAAILEFLDRLKLIAADFERHHPSAAAPAAPRSVRRARRR